MKSRPNSNSKPAAPAVPPPSSGQKPIILPAMLTEAAPPGDVRGVPPNIREKRVK